MKPTLCSRCNKNVAVIFITKIENGRTTNEGLCLKCAKDLGIKQVDDMVKQMTKSLLSKPRRSYTWRWPSLFRSTLSFWLSQP